jgi:hypothetical protein
MVHALFGALTWDPQVKGGLIVFIAVVILPGSVYLLLSTNLGGRLGFLVAAAALFGWMTVMGLIWAVYGIGLKGTANSWVPKGIVQGDVRAANDPVLSGFPTGWKQLALDNPEVAEAQAVADAQLVPDPTTGKKGLFASTSDYVSVAAYERGGEKYLFTLKHRPHYLVIVVQPVIKQTPVPGQVLKPTPNPNAPAVTVAFERNLGALRVPAAEITISCGVLFAILLWVLHRRDKEAMAARAANGAAAPEREPVGV